MQQSQIHFFQLMRFRDFEAGRRQKSVEPTYGGQIDRQHKNKAYVAAEPIIQSDPLFLKADI
jgi:hypothetical protein